MGITLRRSPTGCLLHLAGTTGGGVVTIENIMTAAKRQVKDFKGP